jgi:hypothetical protein
MKKHMLLTAAAFAVVLLVQPLMPHADASPASEKMKALSFLIGSWNCSWHAGPQSGEKLSTFTPVMGGSWLQQTESVKAPNGSMVIQTMHYSGYDPSSGEYMHVGPNADGTYEVAHSKDFRTFSNVHPAGDDATFTKLSDTEVTLSEPFTQGGQKFVYEEKCIKR